MVAAKRAVAAKAVAAVKEAVAAKAAAAATSTRQKGAKNWLQCVVGVSASAADSAAPSLLSDPSCHAAAAAEAATMRLRCMVVPPRRWAAADVSPDLVEAAWQRVPLPRRRLLVARGIDDQRPAPPQEGALRWMLWPAKPSPLAAVLPPLPPLVVLLPCPPSRKPPLDLQAVGFENKLVAASPPEVQPTHHNSKPRRELRQASSRIESHRSRHPYHMLQRPRRADRTQLSSCVQ